MSWSVNRLMDSGVVGAMASVVCGMTLRSLPPDKQQHIIRCASTNINNLAERPIKTLVLSGLITPQFNGWKAIVPLSASIFGTYKFSHRLSSLGYAATGHVAATLTVTGLQLWGIATGRLPKKVRRIPDDVGTSYAVFGALGAALATPPHPRHEVALAAGISAWLLVDLAKHRDHTALGHVLAFVYGAGAARLVRPSCVERS